MNEYRQGTRRTGMIAIGAGVHFFLIATPPRPS